MIPDFEALGRQLAAESNGSPVPAADAIAKDPRSQELILKEIRRLQASDDEFRPGERVRNFAILARDFQVGEELTHTLKMKRNVIAKKYDQEIQRLYSGDE